MATTGTLTDISRAEALARARELALALPARRLLNEQQRRLPDETMAELVASGLMRLNQSRRWGGAELGTEAIVETTAEIARGDAATGWVYALMASHYWLVCLFPDAVQQEMWGDDPDVMMSSSFAASESVCERVDGGYRIRGRWPFSSGSDHAAWAMTGIMIPPGGPDEPPHIRWGILPRSDYRIDDTWKTCALRGTGSNTLVVDGAFVPDHRTVDPMTIGQGCAPGTEVNTSPLFRLPFSAALVLYLAAPALGAAEATFQAYVDHMATKRSVFTGEEVGKQAATIARVGEISAQLDAARLVMVHAARTVDDAIADGSLLPRETSLRVGRDATYAVGQCVEVVERCMRASGGSGLFESHPVQQGWRDVHGVAAHFGFNPDMQYGTYGLQVMGLPLPPTMF